MIFFGHLGITTGAIKTYEKIAHKDKELNNEVSIDYRVVLIGSILPDIIDKPIGAYLFRSTFHNSRIFAHTLLFSVVLMLIGLYRISKRKKNNILLLGICTSIHLILDSMWLYPKILFWPYFGWRFPIRPEGNWVQSDIVRLATDPSYYIAELIGFIIIAYYFIRLVKERQMKVFLRKGKL
jgi:membrane-bound metal-dependent hydrolase YbcI (DUF457 family)